MTPPNSIQTGPLGLDPSETLAKASHLSPLAAGTGDRHVIVTNGLLKERQLWQGYNTKERDAFPLSWDREQGAEISGDLKEQAAASPSASGSPSTMGKRFLGQEKQPGKEELPTRQC